MTYKTEQEEFWASEFGNGYTTNMVRRLVGKLWLISKKTPEGTREVPAITQDEFKTGDNP